MPGLPGTPSFADIYVFNNAGNVGINDYSVGANGVFLVSNISLVQGSEGGWTLRGGAAAVPAPGTAALLGMCLAGLAFSQRRG